MVAPVRFVGGFLVALLILGACAEATPPTTTEDVCPEVESVTEGISEDDPLAFEKRAILAEQNPQCFTVEERMAIELLRRIATGEVMVDGKYP